MNIILCTKVYHQSQTGREDYPPNNNNITLIILLLCIPLASECFSANELGDKLVIFVTNKSVSLGGIRRLSPQTVESSSLKSSREISFRESHSILRIHSKCLISFDSHSNFCVEIAVHLFKHKLFPFTLQNVSFHHCHGAK